MGHIFTYPGSIKWHKPSGPVDPPPYGVWEKCPWGDFHDDEISPCRQFTHRWGRDNHWEHTGNSLPEGVWSKCADQAWEVKKKPCSVLWKHIWDESNSCWMHFIPITNSPPVIQNSPRESENP